jgi:hypothetical protein
MSKPEVYVSVDIETDGPAPGVNSMLALGAAAFSADGEEVGQWYMKFYPLDGARRDRDTTEWWATQPEAWAEVNTDQFLPEKGISVFVRWCDRMAERTGGKLIAVGWPIAFDFAFVNYYCHRFAGRNPLGFAGLDIRSYANGLAGHQDYYGLPEKAVRSMAGPVDTEGLRDHVALDDAIGQGRLFMAMRRQAMSRGDYSGFSSTP